MIIESMQYVADLIDFGMATSIITQTHVMMLVAMPKSIRSATFLRNVFVQ